MARAVLPEEQAGLYAGGLIMAKALLFLPQFVVVVAFPSMSKQGASRRTLAPGAAARRSCSASPGWSAPCCSPTSP